MIDPAVFGTNNVLASVLKARATGRVRRVVLTSSLVAVHSLQSATPPRAGACYTEEDWNADSTVENGEFYPLSKVLQFSFRSASFSRDWANALDVPAVCNLTCIGSLLYCRV